MYKKSLFIFRRSLRLEDNVGLIEALKQSKKVIPAFIFTPEQVIKNSYKSNNCVQFMIESLDDLHDELLKKGSRLFLFFGKQDVVIEKLLKTQHIDAVFLNKDYTKYAVSRDKNIERVCKKQDVSFHIYEDILLNPVGSVLSASNKPYQKYTPYLRRAVKSGILKPKKNSFKNYVLKKEKYPGEYKKSTKQLFKGNKNVYVHGGRKETLKLLKRIKNFKEYDKKRNFLSYQTTFLSAGIKFGCVSIREVYYAFKKIGSKDLVRQLYWRDFYYSIAYHFPYIFGKPLKTKYEKITWSRKTRDFAAWKEGKTGFPIIDACIRELNQTGFMHNRGRLLVSNFLVKVLLIDWRKGEKYFAQKLIDYDPSVNNGNWQWGASCGADSQPYFRIFNPWIQSKKYDTNATYIKKWVPELEEVPYKDIHAWDKRYTEYKGIAYPKPMVDYKKAKENALKAFSMLF